MPQTKQRRNGSRNGDANKLCEADRPAHDWYRFVLSFPPHLVREYLDRFQVTSDRLVLDPFCGTGTTIVECKKQGIPSLGIEGNPMAHFASQVKTTWSIDPESLIQHAESVATLVAKKLADDGFEDNPTPEDLERFARKSSATRNIRTLTPETETLLLANSISPVPLHKALVLLECLDEHRDDRFRSHELLALAKALVFSISNLHFGPEVGVGPAKSDCPVVAPWMAAIRQMTRDLALLGACHSTPADVFRSDARHVSSVARKQSIDAVITSPPYPNEKDYTRTTRLESVLLGFVQSKADLQILKRGLVRSNTRGVYRGDDDDSWIAQHAGIQRIAAAIEQRRIELGKTSGFERLYHRVTKLYFGGMARHLADLRTVLRPGALLAYVVGDQASYLRIMIRTGQLLAEIAESLGYETVSIDLFRTRLATATKEQLREEVVVLRWPGKRRLAKRELHL